MSAIATTLRRHPAWGGGIAGSLAGAAIGLLLGAMLAVGLLRPPAIEVPNLLSPSQPLVSQRLHEHVMRENVGPPAAVMPPAAAMAPAEMHHLRAGHLLREYAPDRAAALDTTLLLREHFLREYGAP